MSVAAFLLVLAQGPLAPASSDWVTTGTDCTVFACADVDGDGRDDVLTINGAKQLCVAYSVRGEKASGWNVLHAGLAEGAVLFGVTSAPHGTQLVLRVWDRGGLDVLNPGFPIGSTGPSPAPLFELALTDTPTRAAAPGIARWAYADVDETRFKTSTPIRFAEVSPPPYDREAKLLRRVEGDVNGDGRLDTLAVFAATLPRAHQVVRVALAPAVGTGDLDSDGVADDDEAKFGTDPLDRDTDDDGLLDGWEVNGLPCARRDLDTPLDPRRQDVIVWVSRYEQLDEAATKKELERAKRLYAELASANPDGSTGVALHYVWGPPVAAAAQGNWWDVGERELPLDARGIMHWMQVTPGGGGQSSETSTMGGSGLHWAAFAHELGHQLSLSHTGDSEPAWCPFYPSLMNYAFNYGFDGDGEKIRFSDGKRRAAAIDERALNERVALPFDDVSYLAKGPFHFTVERRDDGRATWIDWNHDGRENEGVVSADVNYGGSTYGGVRRDVGFTKTGPAMALVAGKIVLASVERDSGLVALRTYLGDETWSEPRVVPDSATESEPVLVGVYDELGLLFVERADGWAATTIDTRSIGAGPIDTMPSDARPIEAPLALGGLVGEDVSPCNVGNGVVLVVSRAADGTLRSQRVGAARDELGGTKWNWSDPRPLDFTSSVPVALALDPRTKEIVVAGSAPNVDGSEKCLHVAWFTVGAELALVKRDERVVGGPKGVVHCTTRPVARFTKDGALVLFHTGWPDANGAFTAYRATQVANRALNDGWLVCLMYDIWTQTKVPVAFETDGTNSVYSYRWDASADRMNMLQVAHDGLGIDRAPMRDFDDAAKLSKWGIRHSILNLHRP